MATSHYCHGKWREGSVASCDRHSKLSKKQANVYRGVGDPGGRSEAPKPTVAKKAKKAKTAKTAKTETKPDKPASSSGSSSSDASS